MNENTEDEANLLFAARNGDVTEVRNIVEGKSDINLNCTGKIQCFLMNRLYSLSHGTVALTVS
jgi:hypothetical protein